MKCAIRSITLFALLFAGLFARVAIAQEFADPPAPSAPRPFSIVAPGETRLANGLRVIVAERHGLPLVTARLIVLSGNETDPAGHAGLAMLTAGLLTQGTRHRSATAIARAAEALGGSLDSGAAWDRSSVDITVTTPKAEEALGLVGEVVTEPVFRQDELDRLRAQSIDALKVSYANPGRLASLVAARMVFGNGAYGTPAGGTPSSLARITRADVLAFYRARYRPDNAVLILVGDIDVKQATTLAERRFGSWRVPAVPLPSAPPTDGTASDRPLTVVDMGSSGQAGVVLALPLSSADAALDADGVVTNSVLGGGYSSRLNQEIRIKRGLSYGAGARLDERRDGGILLAVVQTKNESAADVVSLVQGEFDRIAEVPVPADELSARKATLIGTFSRSVETTSGLASQIASLVARGRSPDDLTTRIERYGAVDAAAVQAYARARFAPSARRLAVAGDASEFEAALKRAVPDLVVVPQEKLDLNR